MEALSNHKTVDWKCNILTVNDRLDFLKGLRVVVADQLASGPVDENLISEYIREIYRRVALPLPDIQWVDSPIAALKKVRIDLRNSIWNNIRGDAFNFDSASFESVLSPDNYKAINSAVTRYSVHGPRYTIWPVLRIAIWNNLWQMNAGILHGDNQQRSLVWDSLHASMRDLVWSTIRSYYWANEFILPLTVHQLIPSFPIHPLLKLNSLVSGYRFNKEVAVLIRRPSKILYSTRKTLITYPDSWVATNHDFAVPDFSWWLQQNYCV